MQTESGQVSTRSESDLPLEQTSNYFITRAKELVKETSTSYKGYMLHNHS